MPDEAKRRDWKKAEVLDLLGFLSLGVTSSVALIHALHRVGWSPRTYGSIRSMIHRLTSPCTQSHELEAVARLLGLKVADFPLDPAFSYPVLMTDASRFDMLQAHVPSKQTPKAVPTRKKKPASSDILGSQPDKIYGLILDSPQPTPGPKPEPQPHIPNTDLHVAFSLLRDVAGILRVFPGFKSASLNLTDVLVEIDKDGSVRLLQTYPSR